MSGAFLPPALAPALGCSGQVLGAPAECWDVVLGDLDLEQGENEMHQSKCEEVELSKMKLFGQLRDRV